MPRTTILKRGIAVTPVKFGISFTLTHLNQAGALVHVYQDGSIHMNHGGTEMGQGLFQKVAQVAADRFGVGTWTGEDHRDGHGEGAQHLRHGGKFRQRSERDGGEGGLRRDPGPHRGGRGAGVAGRARDIVFEGGMVRAAAPRCPSRRR
jgi:hypothetical protein